PSAGVPGGVLLEAVLDQGGHVDRAGDGRGGRQLVEAVLRHELTRGQAALLDGGLADGARALAIALRRAVPGSAERRVLGDALLHHSGDVGLGLRRRWLALD